MAAPHTRGSTLGVGQRWPVRRGCPAHAGIDPRPVRVRARTQGLPRTRGDRPERRVVAFVSIQAAPHTRGSTFFRLTHSPFVPGCPAHAGIDPERLSAALRCARLPRTRGDRPTYWLWVGQCGWAAPHTRGSTRVDRLARRMPRGCPAHAGIDPAHGALWAIGTLAAPHTRGSTRAVAQPRDVRPGCPAHAGIDPPRGPRRHRAQGLPRTRGDRPCSAASLTRRSAAAPHTRGSTRREREHDVRRSGCPAHAGIDPRSLPRSAKGRRLPRTRGDRPRRAGVAWTPARAAPHTRGSTRRFERRPCRGFGCPAHAGIDPRRAPSVEAGRRLPRTRGDRPVATGQARRLELAAPHTRGSTLVCARPVLRHAGCPAHAGIDPPRISGFQLVRRLPRTRGDRPKPNATRCCVGSAAPHTRGSTLVPVEPRDVGLGCPAHAGIDPCPLARLDWFCRLPRTRGDRPMLVAYQYARGLAAPHTRGSTPHPADESAWIGGCPAHAGIDPKLRPSKRPPSGLPRTRGDRPTSRAVQSPRGLAAPHTRGSTLIGAFWRKTQRGCPAHAGIDPPRGPRHARARGLPRTRGDRPAARRASDGNS